MTVDVEHKPRFRGVSHQLAFAVAVVLAPLLILAAPGVGPSIVVGLYAATVIGLFGVSALYHRRHWGPRGRAVMRRLDHSMIFLVIAGTYTPMTLFTLPTHTAVTVLSIVWAGAAAGIALRLFWSDAPSWIVAGPYVAVGWTAIFVMDDLLVGLGTAGFVLLVTGGGLFTVGAAIYATKRPALWPRSFGFHELFHLFVIAGIAVHYVAVAFFALPNA